MNLSFDESFFECINKITAGYEWEWDENKVEIVLKNAENHPEVKFKQVLDFFETLEVDLLRDSSLRKVFDEYSLFDDPYDDIITFIFDMIKPEWEQIIGKNGGKIYESLHRRLANLKLETLLGALSYCGSGFGVRKFRKLLEQISEDNLWVATVHDIVKCDGFDTTTAERVVNGLPKIVEFMKRNKSYFTIKKDVKTDELKDVAVVFTGFRDSALEEKVIKMGGKMQSGVSKKTTYLVMSDISEESGKSKKAKELNVPILSLDEFKNTYNL